MPTFEHFSHWGYAYEEVELCNSIPIGYASDKFSR
jgi:hypothetical protein